MKYFMEGNTGRSDLNLLGFTISDGKFMHRGLIADLLYPRCSDLNITSGILMYEPDLYFENQFLLELNELYYF